MTQAELEFTPASDRHISASQAPVSTGACHHTPLAYPGHVHFISNEHGSTPSKIHGKLRASRMAFKDACVLNCRLCEDAPQ